MRSKEKTAKEELIEKSINMALTGLEAKSSLDKLLIDSKNKIQSFFAELFS